MISVSIPGGQIDVLDWYDISAHSGLLSKNRQHLTGFSPYCPGHLNIFGHLVQHPFFLLETLCVKQHC